jgi:hypothetical protein
VINGWNCRIQLETGRRRDNAFRARRRIFLRQPASMEKPPGGEPGGSRFVLRLGVRPKMRSDRSRSRKASEIIYRHFERKGGNGTITVAPRARGRRPKTFTTAELASRYSHALYKTALAA